MINLFFEVQIAFSYDLPLRKSNAFPGIDFITPIVIDQQKLKGTRDSEGNVEMEDVNIPDWLEDYKVKILDVKILRSYPRKADQEQDDGTSNEKDKSE